MGFSNLLKVAMRALVRNKMRAFLTMLGIIIGVASVIALLAIGEGSKQSINKTMASMGTNMIMIMPAQQERGGVSMGSANNKSLTMSDVDALKSEATLLDAISPTVGANGQVIYGNKNTQTSVTGITEEYFSVRKLTIERGRIFTPSEVRSMAKVCLLGQTVIENLFGAGADPIGLSIRIKNIPFLVIGTIADKGESGMGQDQDNIILAPYTTVQRRLSAIDYINGIYASSITEEMGPEAKVQVEEILRRQHKIKEGDENDFEVMSQSELLSTVSTITDILTYLLTAIAAISLLVGGIGIMNIMYVSVTERTREIGLRMSVGGRSQDILMQFLIESAMLSVLGGAIGIVFGYLIAKGAGSLINIDAVIKTQAVVLAFSVCFAIGVFFGWYPARKAASLNPIDALRYE
jgi:putative ABC transport system permease protein